MLQVCWDFTASPVYVYVCLFLGSAKQQRTCSAASAVWSRLRAPWLQVYVAHLSHGVNEEQLSRVFSDFGEVVHVRIIVDRDTGQPKGYAFVTMASPAQAQVRRAAQATGRRACVRRAWCMRSSTPPR